MDKGTKPVIGITCGDLNGIGIELIIKTFSDHRLLDVCTPVIFCSNKVINFYRKSIPEINFSFQNVKELNRLHQKAVNVFNCWEEEIAVQPGQLTETGGSYAVKSLTAAVQALKDNLIDGLVTAPIHKANTQSADFNFTGHTPFLKYSFGAKDVLMLLYAGDFRVALVTEHLPIQEVAAHISKDILLEKLNLFNKSLQFDFGINKPKIAVLGLNPHAGDEGLIGKEEEDIIKPAIREAMNQNILAFGPYSADAFFARGHQQQFDGVLAMYHDQGLIPFKSLSAADGVNFTAGLPVVRTSPDHGVAFDIAGKNKADISSFMSAVFECVNILHQRFEYEQNHKNPLKKIAATVVLANAIDEKIEDQDN